MEVQVLGLNVLSVLEATVPDLRPDRQPSTIADIHGFVMLASGELFKNHVVC